jgi:hypothetical protein
MTTNTATTSRRVADGVTAAFVRDLSRRSARPSINDRRAEGRRHRAAAPRVAAPRIAAPGVAAPRFGRDRDDCDQRRHERAVA